VHSGDKQKSELKRSGTRRLGDDYQDIVGLEILIDWLEHSDKYRWVKVEADDFGALDDVTAELTNGTLLVRQVKFSTHPQNEGDRLSWDTLLEQKAGQKGPRPSLLQKWASSLAELTSAGEAVDAALVSNRQVSDDLRTVLLPDKTVDFGAIPSEAFRQVERQLGDAARAKAFFDSFKFELNWPNLPDLVAGVKRRFFRLGGTEQGWQNLMAEVNTWVCFRDRPSLGGTITLSDIKRAALWYQLQSLPQRYEIPADYVLPSATFHEELVEQLLGGSRTVTVLSASPGSGKSTYTSRLFEDLQSRDIPVVRHHYFLSLGDKFLAFRIDHRRAAESLMHDLLRDHVEALGDAANCNSQPNPEQLRSWLENCGAYYVARSRRLILILDGLDHVWREQRSVDELNRLFRLLFPLPDGVSLLIATQPVGNAMLPDGLLRAAPRDTWLELPLLGAAETKEWLTHHLPDFSGFEASGAVDIRVERLVETLYRRSRGHPLHLRYTLRAIQEQRLVLDEEVVGRLPECPHGGIVAYYEELWRVIPDEARQILHLLAATRFPWPKNGIVDCLDPEHHVAAEIFTALKHVEHLLLCTDLGFLPFHGSLLAFVSQMTEHADWAQILKQKVLRWLRGPAPEYWKWAYSWRMAADLGDDEPLLAGPDRVWAVDAISKCRPPTDVKDIFGRALTCAAKRHRFPRAIGLGLLKDYYVAAQEPYQPALGPIFLARLLITAEPTLRSSLRAAIDDLTDQEVSLVAEASVFHGDTSLTRYYLSVLNHRLRADTGRDRSWQSGDGLQRAGHLLAVAALPGGPPAESIVRYAAENREQGYSVRIVSIFAEWLRAHRDLTRLFALLDSVPPTTDGDRDVVLTRQETSAVIRHVSLLALEEGANCDEFALAASAESYVQIYAAIRKTPGFQPGDIAFPATTVLSIKRYELYGREQDVDALFTQSFFGFLANHLWDRGNSNEQWLLQIGGPTWPCEFLRHLDRVARDVAAGLRIAPPPQLGEIYTWVSAFPRPESRGNENLEEFQYGVAAVRAVMAASFDFAVVLSSGVGLPAITREDLQRIFASTYCFREAWITRYIALRRRWLTDEAIDWLLADGERALASSLGHFPERAERYGELAALAALHGRESQAETLLRQAAENILAHGNHKDLLFSEVLDAISAYARERPGDEPHAEDQVANWVRRLAAPIAAIGEFTDGDETGLLPNWLASTLANVAPKMLPGYYQWLAEKEEYRDALHALEVFVRSADLTDPVTLAVACTATDDACVRALAERSRGGDQRAAEALAAISSVMGQAVATEQPAAQPPPEPDYLREGVRLPPVDNYPPELFADFLAAIRSSGYWPQDEALTTWGEHWASQARGQDAYDVLLDASERGQTSSAWDAIYRLAVRYRGREAAYGHLVRTYREAHGWNRFWASSGSASGYWQAVKAHYAARWAEFLGDTLLGETASREPALGSGTFDRLVKHCEMMGQRELGGQLVEEMVDRSLELVSPLQLPTPRWVIPEQNASGYNLHLPMLFSRLTWPSPLARERACTAMASLLLDSVLGPTVNAYFLRWLKSQQHESVCGMALLGLLRAKTDDGDKAPISAAELRCSLPYPSLQSALLLAMYEPEVTTLKDMGGWHSGDPPGSFAAQPFFGKYAHSFLPPVYDSWIGEIERRMLIPLSRQWAYEWDVVLNRRRFDLSPSSLNFWLGYREADDRYFAVDTPLSEVYRSAYLRALAWAVDTRGLDRDIANDLAAETVPINLDLWPLRPGTRPDWWPKAAPNDAQLETGPGDIWQAVGELWRRQQAGLALWGSDWVLARADGRVRGGETLYDLSLLACFQRTLDSGAPEVGEVFDWHARSDELVLRAVAGTDLRFSGRIRAVRRVDLATRIGGWSVMSAVGRFEGSGSISRWQWWRGLRGIWGPAACLTSDGYTFRPDVDSLIFESNGELIARWSDWTEELRERHAPNTLPATGHVLLIRRDVIERFAAQHEIGICWVARLTAFCRQRNYDLHQTLHDDRAFGVTRIILPS
jgi:hypothetical protein